MKIKENKKLENRNNRKIKRQISIITVFLWIFLVATMITVVAQNIKNTNALENDNVSIYADINDNVNISEDQIKQRIVKPNKPTINDLPAKNQEGYVYVECIDNEEHVGRIGIRDSSNGWEFGEVKENDGRFGSDISAEDYPWMCELILDKEFYKELFNKNFLNQYGNHYVEESNNIVSTWFLSDGSYWYYFIEDFPMTVWITHEEVKKYTVTYTDGVVGKTIFADQEYQDLREGDVTPEFAGETPTRDGYEFLGWSPEVKPTINSADSDENSVITYTAMWKEIDYTVKYIDGADGFAFGDCTFGRCHIGETTPRFEEYFGGPPFRKGFIFRGWSPAVNPIIVPAQSDEKNNIVYTAAWEKIDTPDRGELVTILGDNFVNVHCVNNHTDEDKVYGVINNANNITISDIYCLDGKNLNLCDVIINGEEYAQKYSSETGYFDFRHYLVKDNDLSRPAVYDEDKEKKVALYYDEKEAKWKILDDVELPVIFNVSCSVDGTKMEGFYKVKHEYYLKDKNNNMILEGVNEQGITDVSFIFNDIIKVGISNEEEKVNIEIKKKPNYNLNGIEYIYEYYENSGNIVIEEGLIKEITLRYVREEENETIIKAEKIWEDENNKYSKRPENVVLQIKNGEEIVAELEVSEENNWSCEFVVPKYDKDGNEIKYTVDEKETSKYYEKIIDGYTVINKYIGDEEIIDNNNEVKSDEVDVDTSDINIVIYISVFIISIIGINIVRKNIVSRKIN